ncbi:FAD-dependent oxidoreductase [soil metagenome]
MHYDIVIAGGGAGGLELAAQLGRKLGKHGPLDGRSHVLLVDRSVFHIWKPTLHEVAAGTLDIHQEGLLYPVLARRNHFSFALGEVTALDTAARVLKLAPIHDDDGQVIVEERDITFRWLVLALGSGSNSFNTPGFEHANVLEQSSDAEAFRRKLLAAFTRHAFTRREALRIAIVGAGATGVELSAELLESHASFMSSVGDAFDFPFEITLVEAGPRILGGLDEKISVRAAKALETKGVHMLTSTRVTAIEAAALQTSAGPIPADLIVWAAGIKAAGSNATFGLAVNRSNQFVVDRHLSTSVDGIFALGDNAACPWVGETWVPARAQAAHQQSDYLAGRLIALLKGRTLDSAEFRFKDLGSLVSLGENRGIGNLMGSLGGASFLIEGLIAKWMYMSLHLMHHRAVLGTIQTIVLAAARLLQRRISGRLKLH